VAAPGVESSHRLGHVAYALWVFVVPTVIASLIEAPISAWSDRVDRSRLRRVAQVVLAAALALSALAPTAWLLSLGLALAGAASGVACAVAQGELVAGDPGNEDRAMSRWALFSAIGDTIAPLLVAAVLWAGGGYRGALLAVAAMIGLAAWPRTPGVALPDDDAEEDAVPLREILGRRRLWGLLVAAGFCALLDEIVVALAALRLVRDLGASEGVAAAGLTLCSFGAVIGSAAIEPLLPRLGRARLLLASGALTLAALAAVVLSASPIAAVIALFLLGVVVAPQHSLLLAAAHELVPGRPGAVNAATQLLAPLDLALPFAVGAVAASFGLGAALAVLALQPILVVAAALWLLSPTP
jgi:MFS family permease